METQIRSDQALSPAKACRNTGYNPMRSHGGSRGEGTNSFCFPGVKLEEHRTLDWVMGDVWHHTRIILFSFFGRGQVEQLAGSLFPHQGLSLTVAVKTGNPNLQVTRGLVNHFTEFVFRKENQKVLHSHDLLISK